MFLQLQLKKGCFLVIHYRTYMHISCYQVLYVPKTNMDLPLTLTFFANKRKKNNPIRDIIFWSDFKYIVIRFFPMSWITSQFTVNTCVVLWWGWPNHYNLFLFRCCSIQIVHIIQLLNCKLQIIDTLIISVFRDGWEGTRCSVWGFSVKLAYTAIWLSCDDD